MPANFAPGTVVTPVADENVGVDEGQVRDAKASSIRTAKTDQGEHSQVLKCTSVAVLSTATTRVGATVEQVEGPQTTENSNLRWHIPYDHFITGVLPWISRANANRRM